ncbi:hypothetical protein B0H67DRAFT_446995, partial [Lasiosphaeris hirsuta]
LALLTTTIAGPSRAFSLDDWLNNPPYANGGTIQEQIECYALPYGAIGFASHVLTYLTVVALSLGRDPLMPWRPLRHRWFDTALALVGFCITLSMTVLTMLRCRNTWPFILIAVWKQVFSTTLTVMAVHAAAPASHFGSEPDFGKIWWWCIPYSLGAIVGFVGIMELVKENIASNSQLKIITGVLGGVALALILADACIYWMPPRSRSLYRPDSNTGRVVARIAARIAGQFLSIVGASLLVMTLLFAFYSDWALAALAGDIAGQPTRDNAVFYWLYFAAKRLPMLS